MAGTAADWEDQLDALWDTVEAEEKERRQALDLSIRAMSGELMAELTVNGRCTAGALARELVKLVVPEAYTEYRLATDTEALRPEQRLCDHVLDGAELTALVVASAAGDFVCQAHRGRAVTLCLGLDRMAKCKIQRNVGGMLFDHWAEGFWEEKLKPGADDDLHIHVTLDQTVGAMSEFVIRQNLQLERQEDGDLLVLEVFGEVRGGGQVEDNMLVASVGDVFGRF